MSASDLEAVLGFVMIGVLILAPLSVRWARELAVARRMRARSEGVASEQLPGSELPEHAATRQPRVVEIDAGSPSDEEAKAGAIHEHRARSRMRRGYGVTLLAGLVYAAALWIGGMVDDAAWQSDLFGGTAALVGCYFVLFPTFRYIYYRQQFSAMDFKHGLRLEHPLDTVARWVLSPDHEGHLFAFFVCLMTGSAFNILTDKPEPLRFVGGGLLLAVVIHGFLVWTFVRQGQKDRNLKLTVLRVFGQYRSIGLTFGGVLRFWTHFGSYFTILDPALVRHRWRFWSWSTPGALLWLLVIWLAMAVATGLLFEQDSQELSEGVMVGSLLAAALLVSLTAFWRAYRSFAGSEAAIEAQIDRLLARPRKLGSNFKSLSLACFDNTWREAVRQFVQHSDVVLMDLRGFSEANQGCAYEVDFLFDHIEIGRILFLVDDDADREPVERLILDRWAYLREDSPNRPVDDPVATVFAASDGRQLDMQRLIDRLLLMADPGVLGA